MRRPISSSVVGFPWIGSGWSASARRANAGARRRSVHLGYERLVLDRRADVVVGLTARELQLFRGDVLVRHARKQVVDAVEAGAPLVVGVYDPPRRRLGVGELEH